MKISLQNLIGARILAHDGAFLGEISESKFKPDSIANQFGEYGSWHSPVSILNELGQYGSKLLPFSGFNAMSMTPPKIYKDDVFIAYLSSNEFMSPRVDPEELLALLNIR